jgi:alkylation response protein AidB-like acyl-CoA dehydrogenase
VVIVALTTGKRVNTLTAGELRAIDAARAFAAAHVRPDAAAWNQGLADAGSLLAAAAGAGLLGLEVPVAHGGLGFSFGCKWRVAEVLAAADFGLAMAIINSHNVANHLARSASPAIVERYVPALLSGERSGCTALTEPDAGSDFSAITTTASPSGNGWQLDGRKTWIVNATHADVIVVYAQTAPGSGARGIAAFAVDATRAGFVRAPRMATLAAPAIDAGGFELRGYRAAADELLHPPGQAFKAALNSINGARTYVAAMCCGMVAEGLRVASGYGERRHTFGQPLHAHQGWRWGLAEAAVGLAAARGLVQAAAQCIDSGSDAQVESAQAKLFATRMAGRHIGALMHAMGAEGLREEHPFMRHLAAAQVAALVDGSTEMLLERVAKDLRSS